MIEKIETHELELMECLNNSLSAVECIFSNLDNLLSEKNCLGHVRTAQIPMLSFEYLLDENSKLSIKENFKLREGAGTIDCFGGRKFGKCEWEENYCSLSDGSRVKFKELVNKEVEVLSLNTKTLKLENKKAKFFDNGLKKCYKFTTKSGKEIVVTENHPLLIDDSWKKASEIKVGDNLSVVRQYSELGTQKVDENIAKILGYLIGDGCCTGSRIGWTNINEELIAEFKELLVYFDCDYTHRKIDFLIKHKKENKNRQFKNKIQNLVKEYNIDCLSKHKRIPKQVYSWKNEYIAILLNRLFACDGCVSKKTGLFGYTSASKELVYDISHLLLRFGIRSLIHEKKNKLNGKIFLSWNLDVNDYTSCDILRQKIGVKSKEQFFKKNKVLSYSNCDLIPNKFYFDFESEFNGFKKILTTRKLKKYDSSRRKWKEINNIVQSSKIAKVIDSDLSWEKIVNIEVIDSLPTVGVSVDENYNYVSNDIISHNTHMVETIDILISIIHLEGETVGFTSVDALHIRGILEPVIQVLEQHTFFKMFEAKVNRSPNYRFSCRNNYVLESVNMNIVGKNPGQAFFQKHFKRLYIEEASLETEEVYKKRIDAISELGCVIRSAGMTNFTKYSPTGRRFFDIKNRARVCNLPQYSNPNWNEKEKQKAIKEHGGENSVSYRIFVKGEVVEEGISVFDMEKVRKNYIEDKIVKKFEIHKYNFNNFKDVIVVDKPEHIDGVFIAADIGETAPTEIIILYKSGEEFKYVYNITCYGLTEQEQPQIFEWLIEKLKANVIGLDTTDGTGRSIGRSLIQKFNSEHFVFCAFNEKIEVDFERDELGNIVFDSEGYPKYKQEFVSEWSVKRLKDLLYEGRLSLPIDYKFDKQINSVIAITRGGRTVYEVASEEDHLFAAFRVFAIMEWQKNSSSLKQLNLKKFAKAGC